MEIMSYIPFALKYRPQTFEEAEVVAEATRINRASGDEGPGAGRIRLCRFLPPYIPPQAGGNKGGPGPGCN